MSDVMLLGVLRMPIPDNPDPMTLRQFVDRARQAADRIEADTAEIERLRAVLDQRVIPLLEATVAAERQRIRGLVEAVRKANAESQDADDCLIYTPAVQRAWIALMAGLEGPNAPVNLTTRAADELGS